MCTYFHSSYSLHLEVQHVSVHEGSYWHGSWFTIRWMWSSTHQLLFLLRFSKGWNYAYRYQELASTIRQVPGVQVKGEKGRTGKLPGEHISCGFYHLTIACSAVGYSDSHLNQWQQSSLYAYFIALVLFCTLEKSWKPVSIYQADVPHKRDLLPAVCSFTLLFFHPHRQLWGVSEWWTDLLQAWDWNVTWCWRGSCDGVDCFYMTFYFCSTNSRKTS